MFKYLISFMFLVVLTAILQACGSASASSSSTLTSDVESGFISSPVHASGAIRYTDGQFSFIEDLHHEKEFFTGVSNDDRYITITYPEIDRILTFTVSPDETMAKEGMSCGASVGLDKAYIYCYRNGVLVDPNTLSSPSSNFWIYARFIPF